MKFTLLKPIDYQTNYLQSLKISLHIKRTWPNKLISTL